ncbi:MAG: tRNA 2-thiouridine(34) synthase MnmA, partial [Chromatiales bacterium]|nr:tRNA 2-thiouridine(34) synthase MnmA [Chromatiales bacterium]
THAKKDSTGICFIGERRFSDFLARYLPARPGEIRALDGTRLGSHHGLMYYTLGQRKGLGLGGRPQAEELPWYVVGKNLDSNTLLVAQGHDHPAMFSRSLRCKAFNWIAGRAPSLPLLCGAKTRYRQVDQPCRVSALGDDLLVDFDQPQRAVTPGQSVVLYADDVCLGGGIIESTTP